VTKSPGITACTFVLSLGALAAALAGFGPPRADAAAPPGPDAIRDAIGRSLKRLETGSANYFTHRRCFSCHHQTMSVLPMLKAERRGFRINREHIREQVEVSVEYLRGNMEDMRKGRHIGGAAAATTNALLFLNAVGHPADDLTDLMVEYLLRKQSRDGSWIAPNNRPPSQGSYFTTTALALRGLRAYAPAKGAAGQEKLRERIDLACRDGLEWLSRAETLSTEDKVFRLRGLVYGKAPAKLIQAACDDLVADQGKDGNWAQLPGMSGDAYATGTAMMALREGGLAADSEAYRKGVKYLLATQRRDGAWIVETRSEPLQKFFDNGDPGGASQFISFWATGAATLALLEALPVR
jgi:N-acyl-D-amino-acid deacylase